MVGSRISTRPSESTGTPSRMGCSVSRTIMMGEPASLFALLEFIHIHLLVRIIQALVQIIGVVRAFHLAVSAPSYSPVALPRPARIRSAASHSAILLGSSGSIQLPGR